jgi:hypothetical protein
MCRELLELLQMEETFGFVRAVTGDESWLYLNYSHTHMWSVPCDQRSVHLDQMGLSENQMFTVLWSIKDL